jgi:hypothetical protein
MSPRRTAITLTATTAMVLSGYDATILTAAVVCVLCVYYTAVGAYSEWYTERRTWTATDEAEYAAMCAIYRGERLLRHIREQRRSDREAAQYEQIRRVLGEER